MITAKVYVVEGHSESLLRRDSSLDLEIIKQVNVIGDIPCPPKASRNSELDSSLHKFDEIFHGIGKVPNFNHKTATDLSAKPVSQHLRQITFSQIEAVNNELDRMLKDDVIEVKKASPWVPNLVIVSKKSGELEYVVTSSY